MLGLSFKRDSDDERDSLAHKLIRLLERELADVAVHDPHVPTPNQSLEDAVAGVDAVFVATNHSRFSAAATGELMAARVAPGCLLVDPWNCLGTGEVFSLLGHSGVDVEDAERAEPREAAASYLLG